MAIVFIILPRTSIPCLLDERELLFSLPTYFRDSLVGVVLLSMLSCEAIPLIWILSFDNYVFP